MEDDDAKALIDTVTETNYELKSMKGTLDDLTDMLNNLTEHIVDIVPALGEIRAAIDNLTNHVKHK